VAVEVKELAGFVDSGKQKPRFVLLTKLLGLSLLILKNFAMRSCSRVSRLYSLRKSYNCGGHNGRGCGSMSFIAFGSAVTCHRLVIGDLVAAILCCPVA